MGIKQKFDTILKMVLKQKFIILILIMFLIIIMEINNIVKDITLKNTKELGKNIAYYYFYEDENQRKLYKNLLDYGMKEIEILSSKEDKEKKVYEFFDMVKVETGKNIIDPYAIIDGEVVSYNNCEDKANYNFYETEWYKNACENPGEVIFTDLYKDAITGEMVTTIALKFKRTDDVLVFDMFMKHLEIGAGLTNISEEASRYLVDSKGKIMYADSGIDGITMDEMEKYVNKIVSSIKSNDLANSDEYFYDYNGKPRTAYYYISDNKCISIITLPVDALFGELNKIFNIIRLIIIFLMILYIIAILNNYIIKKNEKKINETVSALGNSYYAIYRVDCNKEIVYHIKPSEEISELMGDDNSYKAFVESIGKLVNNYNDFKDIFSIERIRNMKSECIREFGKDFRIKFKDGYKWVKVKALFSEEVSSDEIIICFRIIEYEKRLEREQYELLERALEKAKRSEQSKTEFFSVMSHDMKTPLNAIIGFSEIAIRDEETDIDKMKVYIGKINDSSKQLLMLINDILEISKMERGRFVIDNKEVDIQKIFIELSESFKLTAENQDKYMDIYVDVTNKKVMTDKLRISQIINNIMSNAIKFTKKGDKIYARLEEIYNNDKVMYRISIKDTGRGMSKEFLTKIFQPYSRETRFDNNIENGTGLGMHVVKTIVEEMNGTIDVESELGVGTEFTILIPMEVVNSEENCKDIKSDREISLSGSKILVVEDNELNMEITTEVLKMNGIDCIKAWNGKEAIDKFIESSPFEIDAILMDMQMPIMDGCTASIMIRKMNREDAKVVPIIAVTANAFEDDISKIISSGMNGHIAKPIDFDLLKSILEKIL